MDSSKSSNITSTTTITFKSDENKQCFETNKAKNVIVIGSAVGTHDHGSSKIKLTNVVDYKWEVKNYTGRLIAVHLDGQHIAYAIKVNNKNGVPEGMVRVFNSVNNYRALIKGLSSEVLDLQFAHMKSHIMLGCIEQTALHVHKIENLTDRIVCTLIVKIEDPISGHVPLYDKVKWCPFVPESEDEVDDYVGQQLVWFRGNVYQCYSIKSLVDAYGIGTHLTKNVLEGNVIEGSLKQKESSIITGATFSPDGTTLSVSCENGVIRFYQIYFHTNEQNPRCLHKWIPHGGKPITSVFFLDDHKTPNPDKSLWKYAITTSDNNTELKVWCCSTWECSQTINFKSPNTDSELNFKAEIDHKSSYLVLSDIKNRGLYVLQIQKPNVQNSNTTLSNCSTDSSSDVEKKDENRKIPCAYVKSVSEFPLSSPILSFGIVDAAVRRYKCNYSENYLLDDMEEFDEETNSLYCVVIRMYLVQPKSVQECRLLYQPSVSTEADVRSTLSGSYKHSSIDQSLENTLDSLNNANDRLENSKSGLDNVVSVVNVISPKSNKSENHIQTQPKSTNPINLMTPDSFNSTGKVTPEGVSSEVLSTIRMLANVQSPSDVKKITESVNILSLVNNKSLEEHELKIRKSVELTKQNIATSNSPAISGGSSPSREVQEILSVKEDSENILNDEFYDDNNDLLDENDAESEEKVVVDQPYYNKMKDGKENSLSMPIVNNKPDWPKVPKVPVMSNISNANTFNNVNSNTPFNDMSYKLDQVLEFMQTQACQISELRNSFEVKNNAEDNKFKTFSKNIEFNLTKMIEEYLIRYEREHKKKLEAFIAERDKQSRELRDSILHSVAQLVTGQITDRFSTIMINEMQRHVLPIIMNQLDKIKAQIQTDVALKLSSYDQVMKESITKVCSSKNTMETFGNAMALGIQSGLQKTYSETLKSTIIPAYEKTTEEMFRQIQSTFMQGTKSYTKQFEAYMSQYQPMQDDTVSLLSALPEHLKSISDATIANYTLQMQTDITKDLKVHQANLIKSLRENVKKEIQKGFENQAVCINESVLSAVHSQAHTPAPTLYDVQEQIKQHLNQGQINTAFHQALVANDLSLVEFTLEKADYKQVFYPCPLQQTVLLSLIQQISADMTNHNDLKQKYLADAIVSLELRDAMTREHAPKIMRELYQHCQNFITTNPSSTLVGNVKMLMMAVQGLGLKIV